MDLSVSQSRRDKSWRAWQLRQDIQTGADVGKELESLEKSIDGRAFLVPSEQLEKLRKQIDKAAKGAERVGVLPPMLQEVDQRMESTVSSSTGMRTSVQASLVVLTGADVSPGHEWQYLGVVHHSGKTPNWVDTLPGVLFDSVEEFENTEPLCQHCNTKRRRVKTFLVRSPKGDIRQVGYSCLEDYTGCPPQDAAKHLEKLLNIIQVLKDSDKALRGWAAGSGGYDPSSTGFFEPEQYLSWVAKEVRETGWTSRSEAWNLGTQSTADRARTHLLGAISGSYSDLPNSDDQSQAADALLWIQTGLAGWPRLSDYQEQLLRLCSQKLVSYKELPVLAAGFPLWQREKKRMDELGDSRWIGAQGERINTLVTVKKIFKRDTPFGLKSIYYMEDPEGNQLVWHSTSSQTMDSEQTYSLTGTVKRHEVSRGISRTVLKNCRVSEALI